MSTLTLCLDSFPRLQTNFLKAFSPLNMSSFQKSRVPSPYSSLMSDHSQENLRISQARSTNAGSSVSSQSTVSEFLQSKIEELDSDLEYVAQYRRGLREAFESQTLSKRSYDEEYEDLEENTTALQRELVVVKRQRKTIEEDLVEKPTSEQIEEAYTASMMQKRVLAATAKQPKQKFKTGKFREKVEEFYGAAEVREGVNKVHCPLAGWLMAEEVRCAHVVPRILS